MINILSYMGMSLNSEVCLWTMLGLIRTVFDATLFKVNANLKQVWQMNMPDELSLAVQRVLRMMISGVMLTQCFTLYVYLATYIVLLYPVLLEERPTLVLPWLLLAAIRKLLCELTSLALGLGTCVLLGPARPSCIRFLILKISSLTPSFYMWMLVFTYYNSLKMAAAFKTFRVPPANEAVEDYGLELAVRRRRTKSMFDEEQLRKRFADNYYDIIPRENEQVTTQQKEEIDSNSIIEVVATSLDQKEPPSLNQEKPPTLNQEEPPTLNKEEPPKLNQEEPPTLKHEEPPTLNKEELPTTNQQKLLTTNQQELLTMNQQETSSLNQEVPLYLKQEGPSTLNQVNQVTSDFAVKFEDFLGNEISVPRASDRIAVQFVIMLLRIAAFMAKGADANTILSSRSHLVLSEGSSIFPTLHPNECTDTDPPPSVGNSKGKPASYLQEYPNLFRKKDAAQDLRPEKSHLPQGIHENSKGNIQNLLKFDNEENFIKTTEHSTAISSNQKENMMTSKKNSVAKNNLKIRNKGKNPKRNDYGVSSSYYKNKNKDFKGQEKRKSNEKMSLGIEKIITSKKASAATNNVNFRDMGENHKRTDYGMSSSSDKSKNKDFKGQEQRKKRGEIIERSASNDSIQSVLRRMKNRIADRQIKLRETNKRQTASTKSSKHNVFEDDIKSPSNQSRN